MLRIFLIFFACCCGITLAGQTLTFSGRVTDDDTGEGLPFCNVYLQGTSSGISTDIDGYFELRTAQKADSLVASAVGYKSFAKAIAWQDQTINFRLKPSDFMLSEVVVVAGENPANAIVKGIVKNKVNNRVEHLDAMQCEIYKKIELDLDNIDTSLRQRKLFKPFEFIFDHIDSTSDERPYLPAYIAESVADRYFVQGAAAPKDILKAQRASGVDNKTVIEFIGRIHEEYSVYDNWIYVLEKPFASPFSDQGLFYYEYYIIDSTFIQGQWSYKLKFKPRRKQENTFYGDFWVADSSFAIQRVNMRMSPEVNINLVRRVIIYEEFHFEKENWLPRKQKMVVDFVTTKNTPGLIGRKTVSFQKYLLNNEQIAKTFEKQDPKSYHPSELEQSEEYWQEARHEKLSKQEATIYQMVDSIKNVPIYKTYVDVIYTLVSGYKELGMVEIGPYFSMYNHNPVEGHRVKMGVWTSNKFSTRIRFGGFLAYGFSDKRLKFGGDLQLNLRKHPWTVFGMAFSEDITHNNDNSEEIGEGNLFSGFYRRPVIQKLLQVKEGKAFYEKFWRNGSSNRVTFLRREMDPFGKIERNGGGFNFAYLPDPESPSRIDTTVTTTEVIFKTRFAKGEEFLEGEFFRTSLGTKHPVVELQYTAGLKGLLGGEYTYHKLTVAYRHYFFINPLGWLSYKVKLGKVFGDVPFILAEVHPGNETNFYSGNIFNGMNNYEFASDAFVSLIMTHHFDGAIMNKLPLLRKLKLRTVATYKAVWGTMSEHNRLANRLNDFDPSQKDTYTGYRSPSGKPYMEAGVGIENIFKVIRLDALWRLTYLDNPEAPRFLFKGSFEFYF